MAELIAAAGNPSCLDIEVGPGTISITEPIVFREGVRLHGGGQETTTLQQWGNFDAQDYAFITGFEALQLETLTIEDVAV